VWCKCQLLETQALPQFAPTSCAVSMSGFQREVDKAIATANECKWAIRTEMCRHFQAGRCE
jgi:hypothetical protein